MPDFSKITGYDEAQARLRKFLSPRYLELDLLERYVIGTQYDGMPGWYDDNVPIIERGPNIVENLAGEALKSYGDLLCGEDRWPTVTSRPEEDELELSDPLRMEEENSIKLDTGMRAIQRQAKVQSQGRDALAKAMGGKSVGTVASVKKGVFHITNYAGKLCEPEFEGHDLVALEIRYPFLKRVYDAEERCWKMCCCLFRRRIDGKADITYKEMLAPEDGIWPTSGWTVQTEIQHEFGFSPVVWYGFERDQSQSADFDGVAIHQWILSEIDSLNRALSQHNRAALYCGDPQWTESGVSPGEMPGPGGRAGSMILYPGEIGPMASPEVRNSWNKWSPMGSTGGGGDRRRKGPGVVWTYQSENAKAELHSLRGDALQAIATDRDDLRETIASAMSCVRLGSIIARDREGSGITIRNLTGEAIRWLMQPQLARANGIRRDFGDNWILPLMDVFLRMTLVLADQGKLLLPGAKETSAIAAEFMRDFEAGETWASPQLSCRWPPYFEKTALEDMQEGEAVRADYEARIITRETAVQARARRYDIEEVEAYVEKLEHEDEERNRELHDIVAMAGGEKPTKAKAPGTGSPKKTTKPHEAPMATVKTGRSSL